METKEEEAMKEIEYVVMIRIVETTREAGMRIANDLQVEMIQLKFLLLYLHIHSQSGTLMRETTRMVMLARNRSEVVV